MTLIDLCPTSRRAHAFGIEVVCDYLDENAAEPFSAPSLSRAVDGYWNEVRQVINSYLALGFVERLSPSGARPVFYRVLPHAFPTGDAA